jgi:peptide/nickel transport system permease protein
MTARALPVEIVQARAAHRPPWVSLFWLAVIGAGGIVALLIPAPAILAPLKLPGWGHWLGTDLLGRDLGWLLLAGGFRSLIVSAAALTISVACGGLWGVAAGLAGPRLAGLLGRLIDIALAVPALVLALIILGAIGQGDFAVMAAVGFGGAATYARLARAAVATVRPREFLEAARALGAGGWRLAVRHVLPNAAGPLTAYAVLHFGWALVNAASLTFLGFGGSPSAPEWGRMLGEARLVFQQAPWQAAISGLALAFTVLAVQRVGEWWLRHSEWN